MANDGLLDGIRVLDFTIWRPGPYATQLLAELGADVCKIEPPGGDPMRAYPGLFAELNVNKRSVMLDLKAAGGRERALQLAGEADVVIEGFRPGVASRLGIGAAEIHRVNAHAVYCSVSGMGQYGDLSTAPGHDLNFQAWSGALAPDGGAPTVAAVPIADLAGGMAAAFAVCAAVVRQQRTGEGETIDVAMGDVLATWTGAMRPVATGVDPAARGVPGYGTFRTADEGYVALGIITEDHFWSALCDVLEIGDARDLSFLDRMPRCAPLQDRIASAIGVAHPRRGRRHPAARRSSGRARARSKRHGRQPALPRARGSRVRRGDRAGGDRVPGAIREPTCAPDAGRARPRRAPRQWVPASRA